MRTGVIMTSKTVEGDFNIIFSRCVYFRFSPDDILQSWSCFLTSPVE